MRVLIVDDHKDGAISLAQLLRLKEFEVEVCHDGHDAMEKLRKFKPVAMLIDLAMPELDGFDLARCVREDPQYDDVFLMALTGCDTEEARDLALASGIDHFAIKPIEFARLMEILVGIHHTRSTIAARPKKE
jgi:DNA-binding response OmpR family regulator